MLMYDNKRGMHWCMFHEDENCMECTAVKCIHAIDNLDERTIEDLKWIVKLETNGNR